MRARIVGFGALLALLIHLDWHLARPHHMHPGLSFNFGLDWPYHWVATALVFAMIAVFIVRRWPADGVAIAAGAFAVGVFGGQPLWLFIEALIFSHRIALANEAGRWVAFGQTMAAGTSVYALAVWLASRPTARPSSAGGAL